MFGWLHSKPTFVLSKVCLSPFYERRPRYQVFWLKCFSFFFCFRVWTSRRLLRLTLWHVFLLLHSYSGLAWILTFLLVALHSTLLVLVELLRLLLCCKSLDCIHVGFLLLIKDWKVKLSVAQVSFEVNFAITIVRGDVLFQAERLIRYEVLFPQRI